MSFIEAVTTCINKYCVFNGRARRSEYWFYNLAVFVASLLINGAATILFGSGSIFTRLISYIFSLALFLPNFGVTVRRLHDIGKSGWAILIVLVPLAGPIIYIVWLCRDSQPGENQYGPNPKGNFGAAQQPYTYQQPNPASYTVPPQNGSSTATGGQPQQSYDPERSGSPWYK